MQRTEQTSLYFLRGSWPCSKSILRRNERIKQPTSWQYVSRMKWRPVVLLRRGVMTLYFWTEVVTISQSAISSRGSSNISNFRFDRKLPLDFVISSDGWYAVDFNFVLRFDFCIPMQRMVVVTTGKLQYCIAIFFKKIKISNQICLIKGPPTPSGSVSVNKSRRGTKSKQYSPRSGLNDN